MFRKLSAVVLMLGLMAMAPALMTGEPRPKPATAPVPPSERHPNIRKAITALEAAKIDLERADRDFGGHRAEALEAVNNAIKQLGIALQYDK
jgi:hypothetical protein